MTIAIEPSVSPMPAWNARGISASGMRAATPTKSDATSERQEGRHPRPCNKDHDERDTSSGDEQEKKRIGLNLTWQELTLKRFPRPGQRRQI